MKKLKVLSIVLIMLLQVIIPTVTYAMDLNIQAERPYSDDDADGISGDDVYTFQRGGLTETIWKIYDVDDKDEQGNLQYAKALYCLRGGLGFGDSETVEDLENNMASYTNTGDMKENAQTVIESYFENVNFDLTIEYPIDESSADGEKFTPYNAILWILDNAYIPFDINDDEGNKKYEANLYKQELLSNAGITTSELTDDDIEVVQQMALWYFSNYDTHGQQDSFSTSNLTAIANALEIDGIDFTSSETRESNINTLYSYFITNAKANASKYVLNSETGKIENIDEKAQKYSSLAFDKNNELIVEKMIGQLADNKVVGPFKIAKTDGIGTIENAEIKVLLNGEDITEIENQYQIIGSNANGSYSIAKLYNNFTEVELGENFYIVLNQDIRSLNLKLSYNLNYYKTTSTLWQAEAKDQPVVMIEKELITEEKADEVKTKPADLALKKFITKVNDTTLEGDFSREPQVTVQPLIDGATDATYTKKTEPVVVKKGDYVTYAFRVYNEGEIEGIVYSIEDYIPDGLEFASEKNNSEYKYTVDENKVKIEKADGSPIFTLAKFDKEAETPVLASGTVEMVFEVTKEPSNTVEILKNIATMDYEFNPEGIDVDSDPEDFDLDNYPEDSNDEDDDDYEKIVLNPLQPADLALKKYITKVNDKKLEGNESREPKVDVAPLKEGKVDAKGQINANYTKATTPVEVKTNDYVTYAFRVYNEAEVAGSVSAIIDCLPTGIEFAPEKNSTFIAKNEIQDKTEEELAGYVYVYEIEGNKITITRLDGEAIFELDAYDMQAEELPTDALEVVFKVTQKQENEDKKLKNIATIDYSFDNEVPDRDSDPEDFEPDNYPENSNDEDDDDYEEVVIKGVPFDLALQKFITEVNGEEIKESREPVVDTTPLKEKTDNDAKYTKPTQPVVVKQGDIVNYTIRVYNEGERDGYATLISDTLPEGLGLICDYKNNLINKWILPETGIKTMKLIGENGLYKTAAEVTNLKVDEFINIDSLEEVKIVTGPIKITSDYRSDLIEAYDGGTSLDYADIEVTCIVVADNMVLDVLTNVAKLEEYEDENNEPVEDIDTDDHEDDEHLTLKYFDLSLKKFATKVNSTVIEGEAPEVTKNEDKTLTYTEKDSTIRVANGDLVEFTIRVYNEGTIDGYANEVTDFIPEGLEFVVDNETNKHYEWKMYYKNEEGQYVETDDVNKAEIVKTEYLSEENEENIIEAFDFVNKDVPNYKDIKVVFKINETKINKDNADRVLINKAAITEDSGDDEDSNPKDSETPEDDDDTAKVYIKKFDLSLEKDIIRTEVTVDGQKTITEIKNGIAKVEVDKKKINKTEVKFVYELTIKNEGEIPGQATEITDYIPEGLEFYAEDNKAYGWTVVKEHKIITTNILDGVTLNPGESAKVLVVLRWKQNEENLELKRNIAEISEDYNENGAEDIDSTPDNVVTENYKNRQEDDDDYADVLISLKTGAGNTYYLLVVVVITIIGTGVVLIKKYVL